MLSLVIISSFGSLVRAGEFDSLIPPQANVLLISGLAGDQESEKNYAEQMQGWLDLLGNSPKIPNSVYLLSDHSPGLNPPPRLGAHSLPANRQEFLKVGAALAGQTNPLVVVAWGHGGMQGRVPVFHVPGPRLTTDDFKSIAGAIPAVESHWLLFFRGSGNFATVLAKEKRRLITSEKLTVFNSDPVGMALVLKQLRTRGDLSVEALGDELGKATGFWYKERNLARTEEPTLWWDTAAARTLVTPESEAESKPVTSSESGETPASRPAPDSLSTHTNLSPAWKDIVRVEPRNFPEADAVSLRRRTEYSVGSNPALVNESEEFIQILTPEGKHHGDFDFAYSPPMETIQFLACEILRPDGKLSSLDPDAIHEAAESTLGEYQTGRRKLFSLPGVVPGAVLHIHYRTEWQTFPLPHVSMQIPLAEDLPTIELLASISVPKSAAFHFAVQHIPASDPTVKSGEYGTTYRWNFHNLAVREQEVLTAPGEGAVLAFSTFPDWDEFAGWFGRISQLADVITPELKQKAAELTAGVSDEHERVLRVYNYVTGLRYVAVPLGVNSFRPHAADNVLKNQFGDCKDKANLFNALLQSLNLEASLVLVPRFSQAQDALPGFAFNHAISRIKLGGEAMFVDTTDDVCRFGMLPPGDPGRKVLVIDGKPHGLTQLPQPQPDAHTLKIAVKLDCAEDPTAPGATLKLVAGGFPDYELRSVARALGRKGDSPLLAAQFRPAVGAFGLEKQSHSSVSDLGREFTWEGEGRYAGIFTQETDGYSLRVPFWLPREWDMALNRRHRPLFLNQGYPLVLDQTFEISLPAKAGASRLPEVGETAEGPLRWKLEWTRADEGGVRAHLRVVLPRGELTAEETESFQKRLRELHTVLAGAARFSKLN